MLKILSNPFALCPISRMEGAIDIGWQTSNLNTECTYIRRSNVVDQRRCKIPRIPAAFKLSDNIFLVESLVFTFVANNQNNQLLMIQHSARMIAYQRLQIMASERTYIKAHQ